MKVVQIYPLYSLISCDLETMLVIKKKDKNIYVYICETCTEEFSVPR